MPAPGNEKPTLRDNLLRQGVSQPEIQRLYRILREKGYGDEEARRQSQADFEHLKTEKALADRRRSSAEAALAAARAAAAAKAAEDPSTAPAAFLSPGPAPFPPPGPAESSSPGPVGTRRAADWIPEIPLKLRRRINRYAFRNSFLITGIPERWDDFMCTFDRARGDHANTALLRLLADRQGWRGRNPYRLSLLDCLDALRESARRMLGLSAEIPDDPEEDAAAEGLKAVRGREPFVVVYFSVFTQPYDMLRGSLEYIGAALRDGRRVRVTDLARIVRDCCRLIMLTDSIERDKMETMIDIAREVDCAGVPDGRPTPGFADAEGIFRACFQGLRGYRHELYPALLKMIGLFSREEDGDPLKRERILAFLELREEDILTWNGWRRRQRERREQEMRERQAVELARLEQEKAASISIRYEGTLSMMESLFPDSGIERIEQGEFVLPYFANRVFARDSLYQARERDFEQLASSDVMGLVMVLHSLLDDMLRSIDAPMLEKLIGREGYAAGITSLRDDWREAFPGLFEPYLDAVRDYSREAGGDLRYARLYRESPRARGLEERINQLRGRAIRHFGHLVTGREHFDAPRLFGLAARLAGLLSEAGKLINQAALGADDPVSRKTREDLAGAAVVDLEAVSVPGTADYRPVTRQVRRWIEARFRETVGAVPQKAQVAFMDVFRGVAYLYDSLLNDAESFASRGSHAVVTASVEDRASWTRERTERGRDSLQSLQASLLEQFPGQFVDALTGLRNKDYFVTELPRKLSKLRACGSALTFLMIDIDHFKWVNDGLGHSRGDEVLKATTAMILDNIREGDLAVRYGGEEILVAIPSDLHRGIILAERLRYFQEYRVLSREAMEDVRRLAAGGEPCGTLSIGVADVTAIAELTKAVEKVDRALYAAKRGRNAVVYVDPVREKLSPEPFQTYGDYRRKAAGPLG